MFPKIHHIDDVLPFIKDKPEFIIARKEHFTVINYVVSNDSTFDSPMARECRGIKFDNEDGCILARPFHKFFNINQIAETQENIIAHKFDAPHIIMPKLDGSLVHPIMIDNHSIRLCTKMGITDVAMQAEEFIFGKKNYQNFMLEAMYNGYTPLFEWTSRKQQIVLDYPEDNLTLLAIRDNYSGEYVHNIEVFGRLDKIPVVECFSSSDTVHELVLKTKALEDAEGFVVQFSDGEMVKIKSDWYCLRHNSRDLVTREHNLVQLILDEGIDDLKPMLIGNDINVVNDMEVIIEKLIEYITTKHDMVFQYVKRFRSRKDFATSKWAKEMSSDKKSAMFAMLDGKSSRELAIKYLKKHSSKDGMWKEFKETNKKVIAALTCVWE